MIWLAYLLFALMTAFYLRHHFALFQRLNDMHWQAMVLLDIALAFAIFWPLFLVGVLRDRPLPWATVSTFAASCALAGRGWAAKLAEVIDGVFYILTSQRDHCAKSYVRWSAPLGGHDA